MVSFQSESSRRKQAAEMEDNLADTKHELLKIREMLEMAEKVKYTVLTLILSITISNKQSY